MPSKRFQSALPRGERLGGLADCAEGMGFNPRSRAGSDPSSSGAGPHYKEFQSALPRGERPEAGQQLTHTQCFNPRSRAGSDGRANHDCRLGQVSIRAPARGATCIGGCAISIGRFQSALPRGERRESQPRLPSGSSFNPRSRAGSDMYRRLRNLNWEVSIRAPARGATTP